MTMSAEELHAQAELTDVAVGEATRDVQVALVTTDGATVPIRVLADWQARAAGPYARVWKPIFDRCFGFVAAILTLPLLGAVALAIRLTLGPGVLFRQDRVGQGGELFTVYKFRTMHADRRRAQLPLSRPDRRHNHKDPDDPRHTRLGRFLRKWSLDELPQLWNVVRGQMSLVGPRPELASIVARYAPDEHRRHWVKPGLTGLWQISARGDSVMHECLHYDLDYVERVSLWLDLGIMARTPFAMLGSRKGS